MALHAARRQNGHILWSLLDRSLSAFNLLGLLLSSLLQLGFLLLLMEELFEIIARLHSAYLNREESMIHFIPKDDFEDEKKAFVNSCYGKMLAEKEFHINGVQNVLIRA